MSALGHSRPIHSAPVPSNVRYASNSDHSRHRSEVTRSAKSEHRLKCSMDCRRELSVPGYFMAGALPLPGIFIFICISAGMAAPPSFLKVGWSWDDAITSAP